MICATFFYFLYIFYYTHEYKQNKYQIKHGEDPAVIWKTEKENNFLRNIYSLPDKFIVILLLNVTLGSNSKQLLTLECIVRDASNETTV